MSKESTIHKKKLQLQKDKLALQEECERYYTRLYDEEAFKDFREAIQKDLRYKKIQLTNDEKANAERLPEYQIKYQNGLNNLRQKIKQIETLLAEKNNVELVKASNYKAFNYIDLNGYTDKSNVDKLLALQELQACLTPHSSDPKMEIEKFAKKFSQLASLFDDTQGLKFCKAIRIILLSIFTGLIYPTVHMGLSLYHRHTPAFWKSDDELLIAKMENVNKTAAEVVALDSPDTPTAKK